MPDSGLTKNVFLRKSVKVSFSGSPQHPKSNKPTSYRYDTFLNALQKSIIKVSLKCHAALRHPEVTVTVDLYTLGIVFFNRKLHKKDYIVYF